VADLLSSPPRRAREEPDRALLTAIAACGLCGRPVRSAVVSAGQTAYQCDGGGDRIHLARSTAPVDARVRLEVLDRLSRPGAPELLTDRDGPDLYALGAHSAGLRTRLAQVEEGTVAAEVTASLGAELATVEDQMTDHAARDVPRGPDRSGAVPALPGGGTRAVGAVPAGTPTAVRAARAHHGPPGAGAQPS
jgi:hypothetical protein